MRIQFSLCSLAWGLRLPFQSKCDKYWTLSVDSLYATCLLDYMDGSYNNTVMSLSLFRSQYLRGHPALLLKESYKTQPCFGAHAYTYLAIHDSRVHEQDTIRLRIF